MPDDEPDVPPTPEQIDDMFACLSCPHCRGCIEHDVMFDGRDWTKLVVR